MIAATSIDKLYSVFASVSKPKAIDYCPCCMTNEEIETLLSVPLNKLPFNLIGTYAADAFLTVGGEFDYHYFFPRIMDLAVTEVGFWPDWEIILGNLKRASWTAWPQIERDTIRSIIDEHFDHLISQNDEFVGFELDELLCGIARSGLPLSPYLQKLEYPNHMPAFESFVVNQAEVHASGKLRNEFWKDVPDAAAELGVWLQRDQAKRVLETKLGMSFNK